MSWFRNALKNAQPPLGDRRWLFVPYDQLTDALGPLSREDPKTLGVVLIENAWKARRRPYHRQKLAFILCNMRRFALEQAKRGVAIDYRHVDSPYGVALAEVVKTRGPLRMMAPAERELDLDLRPLVDNGQLEVLPHEGWLTRRDDFLKSQSSHPWRMDAFYRHIRKRTGILMDKGKPLGGKYSHDAHNRHPWDGDPPAPKRQRFRMDPLKAEVGELIETHYGDHPGALDLRAFASSAKDSQRLWAWVKEQCMEFFGPYEDAMSSQSAMLFHTGISALVNIHRLTPKQVVDDVLALDIPLASKEGFVRQVIGWREFVRHVHVETDGFRDLPDGRRPESRPFSDGGWGRWSKRAWDSSGASNSGLESGAHPEFLEARRELPMAYWGQASGLECLDRVVQDVWRDAYSHHISRLMVLSNIASLLGVSARQLTDWFWVAYIDAFDWVVEPNVLAMGSFGVGPVMTTKPYISGSGYISKMSDYCQHCVFDPKKNCPLTRLYWQFLERNKEQLADNFRIRPILTTLSRRSDSKKEKDREVFEVTVKALDQGRRLSPESYEL